MAKISFVVPFYKVQYEYMHQCLSSILGQTFADIEVILVDDGSPDDCGKICDEYKAKDDRVVVVHKPNGGLSDARNAGIAVATSEWITFVDGDDWIELDYCQHFVDRISNQKDVADIYYYSGFRNYPSKVVEGVPHFQDGKRFVSYEEREFLQTKCCTIHLEKGGNRKGITISSAWAKMYKLDFIKQNNLKFPIVPYDEDSIFYIYSIEAAKNIEYVSKSIYHYRFTENSIVNRYRPDAVKEQEIYLANLFEFARNNNKSKSFKNSLYMRTMTSMLLLLKLKFFNVQNTEIYLAKWRKCDYCFKSAPYKDVFHYVNFFTLGRNAKIKYILLRLKCYSLIERMRKWNFAKLES